MDFYIVLLVVLLLVIIITLHFLHERRLVRTIYKEFKNHINDYNYSLDYLDKQSNKYGRHKVYSTINGLLFMCYVELYMLYVSFDDLKELLQNYRIYFEGYHSAYAKTQYLIFYKLFAESLQLKNLYEEVVEKEHNKLELMGIKKEVTSIFKLISKKGTHEDLEVLDNFIKRSKRSVLRLLSIHVYIVSNNNESKNEELSLILSEDKSPLAKFLISMR